MDQRTAEAVNSPVVGDTVIEFWNTSDDATVPYYWDMWLMPESYLSVPLDHIDWDGIALMLEQAEGRTLPVGAMRINVYIGQRWDSVGVWARKSGIHWRAV